MRKSTEAETFFVSSVQPSGQSRLAYCGIWEVTHFMVSLMPQLVCYRVSIMLLGHVRVTQCRQHESTIQEDYDGSAYM